MNVNLNPEIEVVPQEFEFSLLESESKYVIKQPLEFIPPGAQLPEDHEYWIYCHGCGVWEEANSFNNEEMPPSQIFFCIQDDEAEIEVHDFRNSGDPYYAEIRRKTSND